jgi:hypothetical protein
MLGVSCRKVRKIIRELEKQQKAIPDRQSVEVGF